VTHVPKTISRVHCEYSRKATNDGRSFQALAAGVSVLEKRDRESYRMMFLAFNVYKGAD